jgi:hypothetical protein
MTDLSFNSLIHEPDGLMIFQIDLRRCFAERYRIAASTRVVLRVV